MRETKNRGWRVERGWENDRLNHNNYLLQYHKRQLGRKRAKLVRKKREKSLGKVGEVLGKPGVASRCLQSAQHDARMLARQFVGRLAKVDGRKATTTPKLREEMEGGEN